MPSTAAAPPALLAAVIRLLGFNKLFIGRSETMSAGSKSGLRYSSHPGLVRASPGPPSQSFSRPSNETHRASPAGPAFAFGGEQAQ